MIAISLGQIELAMASMENMLNELKEQLKKAKNEVAPQSLPTTVPTKEVAPQSLPTIVPTEVVKAEPDEPQSHPVMYQEFISAQGNLQRFVEGYQFRQVKTIGVNGEEQIRWRCLNKSCKTQTYFSENGIHFSHLNGDGHHQSHPPRLSYMENQVSMGELSTHF